MHQPKEKKPDEWELGQSFWAKKLHTLVTTGNGAALVLIGGFIGKEAGAISSFQENIVYFIPFLLGLFFSGVAVIAGIEADYIASGIRPVNSKQTLHSPRDRKLVMGVSLEPFKAEVAPQGKLAKRYVLKAQDGGKTGNTNQQIEAPPETPPPIKKLVIKRMNFMVFSMYLSALCFVLGIIFLGLYSGI